MRIKTHLLTGASIGIAFAPDVSIAMASFFGAVLPDVLDKIFSFNNFNRWQKIHRTWSHNICYWCIVFIMTYALMYGLPYISEYLPVISMNWHMRCLIIFCALGISSHILLDLLTPMGIPWFPLGNNHRLSLRLIKVQSWGDIALGYIFLIMAIGWFVYDKHSLRFWFLSPLSR